MKTTLLVALAMAACVPACPLLAQGAPAAAPADDRPDIAITGEERDLALGNVVQTVREQHFSVADGARIAAEIERRWRAGRYSAIAGGRALAAALTAELREVSGDPHFLVDYFVRARPFPQPAEDADVAARQQEFALMNYGVRSAERLAGNIGYLRLDRFGPAQDAGPVLVGAMAMLSSTEALIIDLRYNGGGYGDTVAFLAGQLLPEPARLSDFVARDGVTQSWTPVAINARYLDKPVYVLTSARTFSAAEGFAYDLRALGRVKVVGETTRGGANPVNRVLLSSRFWMMVPVGQTRNPATGGNWQGTGVAPDVAVPADQALTAAQRDAAAHLIARHKDDPLTAELEALLAAS